MPLVILGNYELWPPSYIFSCPGQVVLRYLPPIKAADIKTKGISRDALSRDGKAWSLSVHPLFNTRWTA